jgi:hypothetical protein
MRSLEKSNHDLIDRFGVGIVPQSDKGYPMLKFWVRRVWLETTACNLETVPTGHSDDADACMTKRCGNRYNRLII